MTVKEHILQDELEAFEAVKLDLLKRFEGKFVVFKASDYIGPFSSYADAYAAGMERFGIGSMLIKRVETDDPSPVVPSVFLK